MFPTTVTNNTIVGRRCHECDSEENLGICLTCQSVACNHLHHDHLYSHFILTQHVYAWDFKENTVLNLSPGTCFDKHTAYKKNTKLAALPCERFMLHKRKSCTNQEEPNCEFELEQSIVCNKKLQQLEGLVHQTPAPFTTIDEYYMKYVQQQTATEMRLHQEVVQEKNQAEYEFEDEKSMKIQVLEEKNHILEEKIQLLTKEKQETDNDLMKVQEELENQKRMNVPSAFLCFPAVSRRTSTTWVELKVNADILSKIIQEQKQEINGLRHNLNKVQKNFVKLQHDYAEEKLMNEQLRQNQNDLISQMKKKDKEIEDLQEQVRDLLIHFSSETELMNLQMADELETSQIVVRPSLNKTRRRNEK
ncbi:unnamed protein product [Rotaria socialis]